MGERRKYWGIILSVAAAILIIVIIVRLVPGKKDEVTAAVASRELALMLGDPTEIESVTESRFAGEDRDNWYVPYMDYLYEKGLLNRQMIPADRKGAAGPLTMEALKVMADGLGLWQGRDIWRQGKVTAALWTEFLDEVLLRYGGKKVRTETLSVYGTAANVDGVEAWHVVTERGEYTFGGFSMDACLDCRIQAWVRGREIIRVREVLSDEVDYENMLVTGVNGKALTVFFAGYSREFTLAEQVELDFGQIVDLQLEKGQVRAVRRKRDTLDSRIITVEDGGAELEGYGFVPFSDTLRVYRTYGNISQKTQSDIIIGYDIYDIVVAEGKICAVLIRQSPDARTIRVLLTEGSGAVKCHPSAVITSDTAFTVRVGEEAVVFQAGDRAVFEAGGIRRESGEAGETGETAEAGETEPALMAMADGQRAVIEADGKDLTVLSLTRTFGNPAYPGKLEVLFQDGGYYLINEALIEDYLCLVVPAEMPADYHSEALRAQAICARGFAANQLSSSRYKALGAHVDDTVNYQVYNYVEPAPSAEQAVRDTYGKVLTLDGSLVTTYYFSTSCGYTSDVSLWGENPENSPYLTSKRMSGLEQEGDIRDEETFRSFIMDTGLNDYERNYGWYRWKFSVSLEELTAIVNARLANLSEALKSRVMTRQWNGSWTVGAGSVGQVEKVEVTERGAGGVASAVEITGSERTVRILLQSAIREVLGSADYEYQRIDGSTVSGRSSLASGYFCLEPEYREGELTGYIFYGGGSGHGIGMSQNCANALGQSGVKAEEMLKFFYTGTEITALYQ